MCVCVCNHALGRGGHRTDVDPQVIRAPLLLFMIKRMRSAPALVSLTPNPHQPDELQRLVDVWTGVCGDY